MGTLCFNIRDDDDGNDVDLVVVNQVSMKTRKLVFNGKLWVLLLQHLKLSSTVW